MCALIACLASLASLASLAGLASLASLALLLGAAPAQAQTSGKLVSNTGKTRDGTAGFQSNDAAQAFTTGSNSDGYTLTRVDLRLARASTTPTYNVTIREDSSGSPAATSLGTLTNPALPTDNSLSQFSASGTGIDLTASTKYWVVVEVTAGTRNHLTWRYTNTSGEDSDSLTGWSINEAEARSTGGTSWSDRSYFRHLAIHGYAKDTTAPSFQSATVNGTALTVTFDENLDTGSLPAGSAFTVSGGRTGTGTVSITAATVSVTLNSAVTHNETVTVNYAKPGANPLRDTASTPNEVANFSSQSVANNTPDPDPDPDPASVRSATVDGRTVTVTFGKALRESSVPAPSAFDVRADDERHEVRHALIDGAVLTLRLFQPVDLDRAVTLSYRQPSRRPLIDVDGSRVRSFSNQTVKQITPTPAMPFAAVVVLALLLARRGRRGLAP